MGKGGGRGGLSLNTLSPDRINYSDVSICQRVPAARLGDRDLPPDGERGGGTNGRIRGERDGETGRRKDGGGGRCGEKGGRVCCAQLPFQTLPPSHLIHVLHSSLHHRLSSTFLRSLYFLTSSPAPLPSITAPLRPNLLSGTDCTSTPGVHEVILGRDEAVTLKVATSRNFVEVWWVSGGRLGSPEGLFIHRPRESFA